MSMMGKFAADSLNTMENDLSNEYNYNYIV